MSAHGRQVDPVEFRRVCSYFATGVTVAGVRDPDGTPHGLTVNSFTSVSLEPPLVLVCLDHSASVIDSFHKAAHFGISILSEEQKELSARFARKGENRFDGIEWHAGRTGVPLLDHALVSLECAARQCHTAGDHDIFVGQVVDCLVGRDHRPLVYFGSRYRKLG